MKMISQIHTLLALFFPTLDMFLKAKTKDYSAPFSLYIFIGCAVLLKLSAIFKTGKVNTQTKVASEFRKIFSTVLAALAVICATNLLFYIPTWFGMIVTLAFYFFTILITFMGSHLKRTGFFETVFCFFFIPFLIWASEICFYGEIFGDIVMMFMPINLIYFTLLISSGGVKTEKKNDPNYNIFRILSRQDSFRAIVIIYFYLFCSAIIDAFKQATVFPLFPFIFLFYSFLSVANMTKCANYVGALQENKRTYMIFTIIYIFTIFI